MSQAAQNLHGEFWRPPAVAMQETGVRTQVEACPRCGTEFVVGARFCHVCGTEREPIATSGLGRWFQVFEFGQIRRTLGLSIGSLVAFIAGIIFVIAAIATGLIYTANTLLDWQAVQVWRIQWLLAAAVAFLAGVLLKRSEL